MKFFLLSVFTVVSFSSFAHGSLKELKKKVSKSVGTHVSHYRINKSQFIIGLRTLARVRNASLCVDSIVVANESEGLTIGDFVTVAYNLTKEEMESLIFSNCMTFSTIKLEYRAQKATGVFINSYNGLHPDHNRILNRDQYAMGLKTLTQVGNIKECVYLRYKVGVYIGFENIPLDHEEFDGDIVVAYNSSVTEMKNFIFNNCRLD